VSKRLRGKVVDGTGGGMDTASWLLRNPRPPFIRTLQSKGGLSFYGNEQDRLNRVCMPVYNAPCHFSSSGRGNSIGDGRSS